MVLNQREREKEGERERIITNRNEMCIDGDYMRLREQRQTTR